MKHALVILATILCVTTTAVAQSAKEIAVMGCQNAVANKVRASQPSADSVRFAPNAAVSAKSSRETAVDGGGEYLDKVRNLWRPFTYSCIYNVRSAETRVVVKEN